MKKIKIAQVGIGHDHALDTYNRLVRQSDIFDFVGFCVCDGEEGRPNLKKYDLSKQMTFEELLNIPGLEAVAIECDDWNLTKYSHLCADAGLHIHMDKPGSEDCEEFERMLALVKKNNLVFQAGYMYRYNPVIMNTMKKIKDGVYGDIYAVEAQMSIEHTKEKREWLGHFKGGMMNFLGCHLVDVIFSIMGVPENIIPMNRATDASDVRAKDYGFAVFEYKNGISFAKSCANEIGGYNRRQIVVCGTKGTCEIKPIEIYCEGKITTEYIERQAGNSWHENEMKQKESGFDRYELMMSDFAAYIRGKKENPYTLEYEARLHRILIAACGYDVDFKAKICL